MHNADTQCRVEQGEEAKGQTKIFIFKFSLTYLRIWMLCMSSYSSSPAPTIPYYCPLPINLLQGISPWLLWWRQIGRETLSLSSRVNFNPDLAQMFCHIALQCMRQTAPIKSTYCYVTAQEKTFSSFFKARQLWGAFQGLRQPDNFRMVSCQLWFPFLPWLALALLYKPPSSSWSLSPWQQTGLKEHTLQLPSTGQN